MGASQPLQSVPTVTCAIRKLRIMRSFSTCAIVPAQSGKRCGKRGRNPFGWRHQRRSAKVRSAFFWSSTWCVYKCGRASVRDNETRYVATSLDGVGPATIRSSLLPHNSLEHHT